MALLPRARKSGLIVKALPEEVLVYDLDRDRAICLNQTAALVWQHCDGQTKPEKIARILEEEFQLTSSDDIVSLALERLEESHLLDGTVPAHMSGVSRRELIRRLGIAAAVPIVTLILVPSASAQGSCKINEEVCEGSGECCSGCCVDSTCVDSSNCVSE